MPKRSGGGAAAAGGLDFQNRVASWFATRILAESEASAIWSYPASTTFDAIWCEADSAVDDLLVRTSNQGAIFVQAKTSVALTDDPDSGLRAAIEQCVGQYIANRDGLAGENFWERTLSVTKDRLILAVGPSSPASIKSTLPGVLGRIRSLSEGDNIKSVTKNDDEEKALEVLLNNTLACWHAATGEIPSNDSLINFFKLLIFHCFEVGPDGRDEIASKDLLGRAVLRNPVHAPAAWSSLISFCAVLASKRRGASRGELQRCLIEAGLDLQIPRGYREDINRIRALSENSAKVLRELSHITFGGSVLKIERESTKALRAAAETKSLVVVGQPGAGKSGALHDLASMLEKEKRDYLLLAADRLTASTLPLLRAELGLDHDVSEILLNWPGNQPGFLILDALDAARSEPVARALRDLIVLVLNHNPRWRVIASIRKFDLRYSPHLRELFGGQPPTAYRDSDFIDMSHVDIPCFEASEIDQLSTQAPSLHEFVRAAPEPLRDLIKVPFNLRLVAQLFDQGVRQSILSAINTQFELLDKYWIHRVIREDALGDARESILRDACELMVSSRRMQVDRSKLASVASSPILKDLLSWTFALFSDYQAHGAKVYTRSSRSGLGIIERATS